MVRRLIPVLIFIAVLFALSQAPLSAALEATSGLYVPLALNMVLPTPTLSPTPETTPSVTPKPTSGPTPTPTLPPTSFVSCGIAASAAPNYPVKIVAIDKQAETVTIENVSTAAVEVDGWRICSLTGAQQHALLSGSLAPGERKVIVSQAGTNIWNNSSSDPGALWTTDGREVSYWPD